MPYSFDEQSVRRISDTVRRVEGDIQNIHQKVYAIHAAPRRQIWIWIIGDPIDISPNRWKYEFIEVRPMWDTENSKWIWEQVPEDEGGIVSHEAKMNPDPFDDEEVFQDELYAYNSVEAHNTGAGTEGNSVDVDNLPDGFELQPVQGGPIVRAWVDFWENDNHRWMTVTFDYENAIDGECPEDPPPYDPYHPITTGEGGGGAVVTIPTGESNQFSEMYYFQVQDLNEATLPEATGSGQVITITQGTGGTTTVYAPDESTIEGESDVTVNEGESIDFLDAEDGKWVVK